MGYTTALALEEELGLEVGLAYHLQGNHYPPVPVSMVQPCIDAIDAFYDEEYSREINLPEGVSSGTRLRVKGKGVRKKNKPGDLFVKIKITVPKSIPQELKESIQKWHENQGVTV